jgi:hypothetical protein
MDQSKEARFLHGLKAVVSSGKRDERNAMIFQLYLYIDRQDGMLS